MMIGLPVFLHFVWYSCAYHRCSEVAAMRALWQSPVSAFKKMFPIPSVFSIYAVCGWYLFLVLQHILLPGKMKEGYPTAPDGRRYMYKCNGLISYLMTIALFFTGIYVGVINKAIVDMVWTNWAQIMVASEILAYSLSLIFYFKGWIWNQGQPKHNFVLDFFYGYEVNPRFFNIVWSDVKWLAEGRALMTWNILIYLIAYKQYLELRTLTIPTVLTCVLHTIYIAHYFWDETIVLSMVDFTSEHFGWMLLFGNIVFLPFAYITPEFYALQNPKEVNVFVALLIFVIYLVGYYIFASANKQRKQFRNDPTKPIWGKPPVTIKTGTGKDLLISGWWAYSRKMNYFGDLIQAWCFGLAAFAGVSSFIPYVNGIFLTLLLIQREQRDSEWCSRRYGEAWKRYCAAVPWRIIPYVY